MPRTKGMPSFVTWVLSCKNELGSYGDLAGDVRTDDRVNRRWGYKSLRSHLVRCRACDEALTAVDELHAEFRQALAEWKETSAPPKLQAPPDVRNTSTQVSSPE